jgi:hypothetical protein
MTASRRAFEVKKESTMIRFGVRLASLFDWPSESAVEAIEGRRDRVAEAGRSFILEEDVGDAAIFPVEESRMTSLSWPTFLLGVIDEDPPARVGETVVGDRFSSVVCIERLRLEFCRRRALSVCAFFPPPCPWV